MGEIRTGTRVPSIALPDQNGERIDPSKLQGRTVLLSFHPLAWTSVCQRQMEALEMNVEEFERRGAVAFGISVDPTPSKKAWADSIGVKRTKLLSDFWPHGAAASALGIFREADGFSERANILVDRAGIVRWVKVYPIREVPDIAEVMRAIDQETE